MQSQFGKTGYNVVCGFMGIFAYGAMVAYLIGIGAQRGAFVRGGGSQGSRRGWAGLSA